jgi:hypothetical protein
VLAGEVKEFFDILENAGGLTEEFLYEHQPVTDDIAVVYSTSRIPVGKLDVQVALDHGKTILEGPLLVIARKGYAGRTFVVSDPKVIIHEDAYAIRPKESYLNQISLEWFAGHYSNEFQSFKTANEGIGDFPRIMLKSRKIMMPKRETQDRLAELYRRRDILMEDIGSLGNRVKARIEQVST